MRLSEAMALGRVTCQLKSGNWNVCILGAAANAVGIPQWGNYGDKRWLPILAYWPWLGKPCPCGCLRGDAMDHIYQRFDDRVCTGGLTIERLIDWVRHIEPKPLALPDPAPTEVHDAVCELVAELA